MDFNRKDAIMGQLKEMLEQLRGAANVNDVQFGSVYDDCLKPSLVGIVTKSKSAHLLLTPSSPAIPKNEVKDSPCVTRSLDQLFSSRPSGESVFGICILSRIYCYMSLQALPSHVYTQR